MTATRSLSASLHQLGRTLHADELAHLSDAELVARFVESRDEGAFAALVRRYGFMVFGVCRRVLRHEQDAEDAFQATFLVFARDAGTLQRAGAIGNWLYGVAHNVARKARGSRTRRDAKEYTAAALHPSAVLPVPVDDLKDVLDGELGALPDKYRAPIVLCDLLGLTTQQAAVEVGCPPKTLGTRLSRARLLLARRLTRRGVALTAGTLPSVLAPHATGAVPVRLLDRAVTTATRSATVPPSVAALTTGVSTVMAYKSLKFALLACGLVVIGGLVTPPVIQHLHAAHAPKKTSASVAGTSTQQQSEAVPPKPPANAHKELHQFFMRLIHGEFFAATTEEKKDDKPETLSGAWGKKDGELRVTFEKTELKISPHGKDDLILILCEYTVKDGLVKAKITGFEGKAEAKKAIAEKLPIGTEFTFKWGTKNGTATIAEVKGEKVEMLASHLEGEFEEKK